MDRGSSASAAGLAGSALLLRAPAVADEASRAAIKPDFAPLPDIDGP